MRRVGTRARGKGEVRRRRARRLRDGASHVPGADRLAAANALDRHVALIGFMGAGKSTMADALAGRLGRSMIDVDREIERGEAPIAELFVEWGEEKFRQVEAAHIHGYL